VTDWRQIVALYNRLVRIQPSPVVQLNRAVAIAMRDGPEAGLAHIDAVLEHGELANYYLAHSARADMYRRLGRTAEAALTRTAMVGENRSRSFGIKKEIRPMPKYVVLNFEDKYLSTHKGAADSTIQVLQRRYEQTKQTRGLTKLFVGKNSLIEHRPVEVNENSIAFTKDFGRIQQIAADCATAEKIYVVAHGDPRTPDTCYTNSPNGVGVLALATFTGLANFLKSVVRPRTSLIRISLVMCYGARCARYKRSEVDHTGMIDADDIKTSFAYKLFKELAEERKLKMTAVTGKIQHETTQGCALVEHEDMIDENMEFSEAARAQTQSKGDLVGRYKTLLNTNTASAINAEVKRFREHPGTIAITPLQQYAQDMVNWENADGNAIMARVKDAKTAKDAAAQNLISAGQNTDMRKYGKFMYTYKSGTLKIVSKYGKMNDPVMLPMTVLYQGPLL